MSSGVGGTGNSNSSSGSSGTSGSSSTGSTSSNDPFGSVNLSDFMTLMITQLQNQDPTDPVSNSDLMQQIGDMQTIQSNLQLSSTLTGMSMSDSLTAASVMIGQYIVGTDSTGASATGTVDSVSMSDGTATLNVGSQSVPLANVTEIIPAEQATSQSTQ